MLILRCLSYHILLKMPHQYIFSCKIMNFNEIQHWFGILAKFVVLKMDYMYFALAAKFVAL